MLRVVGFGAFLPANPFSPTFISILISPSNLLPFFSACGLCLSACLSLCLPVSVSVSLFLSFSLSLSLSLSLHHDLLPVKTEVEYNPSFPA